jgi:sulfite reductase (NADPH) flavoprotein alpha-component
MNSPSSAPAIPLIPENAPFSPEQRAWLNGFFAGLLAPGALAESPALAAPAASEDDTAPWHDPTIALDARMKLAEGKPLRRRLMAAMAQQDCGQCGYNCETYADAIASLTESRLNLCAPGQKETARTLKALTETVTEKDLAANVEASPKAPPAASQKAPGFSREAPVEVSFTFRKRLNKEDSEKSTYHIEFDLTGSGLDYAAGDSFGVFPQNDPALVEAVLNAIHAPPDFPIGERSLKEVLLNDLSLGSAPDAMFELVSYVTGGERRQKARLLAKGEDPDGDAATLDVLAALEKFPGIRPDPEAFVEALEPLQPRLYSISSSPKSNPNQLSLTVDHVRYLIHERVRRGVASSWLCEMLRPHTKLKAYVQRAHDFALPASGGIPIIMVGPGTGIAPFRSFLQERLAIGAEGGAWLFFGHQRRAADFFYEEEMEGLKTKSALTKLSLAWSRDTDKKIYVQDKMREEGKELWNWLERGAHFYVCGDAKRMASDVEKALIDIVAKEGGRDLSSARGFLQDLRKSGRYQTDVY